MKQTKTSKQVTVMAIIALVAAIGFGMAGCDNDPEPAHVHTWGTWQSDATQHWKECTANDGAKTDVANHTGDPCTDCGYSSSKTLTGITAAYNSTTTIYTDTTLDTLKEGLTVTAKYSDNSTAEVTDYTLSVVDDTLIVGENTVTVTYTEGGVTKTNTFTVSVSATHVHNWSKISETPATCTTAGTEVWECTAVTPSHREDRPGAVVLGHDAGEWHTTLEPNCTTTGSKELRCTRDDFVLNTEILAIDSDNHDWNTETGLCDNDCGALYYELGDTGPGGGIIFYVSAEGFTMTDDNSTAHYLEAAPADMTTTLAWASSAFIPSSLGGTAAGVSWIGIPGTTTAIGTGRTNTAVILATDTNAPAAKACNEYSNDGKTDWFLPSYDELKQLYVNRTLVDNMVVTDYWSSSQSGNNGGAYLPFEEDVDIDDPGVMNKHNTFSVRAVRAF